MFCDICGSLLTMGECREIGCANSKIAPKTSPIKRKFEEPQSLQILRMMRKSEYWDSTDTQLRMRRLFDEVVC